MYCGLITLEQTLTAVVLVVNSTGTPTDADALPVFRVYSSEGVVASGTCAFLVSGTITTATNATPVVVTTSAAHGLNTGARITVSGVTGNSGAIGTFVITKLSSTTFSLNSSTGAGAGTGGAYHVVGAYVASIAALGANGFEAGDNYTVLADYALSTVAKAQTLSFTVV